MRQLIPLVLIAFCTGCSSTETDQASKEMPVDTTLTVNAGTDAISEEVYYPSGELKMKGQTRNGKRHGLWTAYFENGGIWSKTEFDNGLQHGTTTVFHKNSMIYYTGNFDQGERSGVWTFYDEAGEEVQKIDYDEKE